MKCATCNPLHKHRKSELWGLREAVSNSSKKWPEFHRDFQMQFTLSLYLSIYRTPIQDCSDPKRCPRAPNRGLRANRGLRVQEPQSRSSTYINSRSNVLAGLLVSSGGRGYFDPWGGRWGGLPSSLSLYLSIYIDFRSKTAPIPKDTQEHPIEA